MLYLNTEFRPNFLDLLLFRLKNVFKMINFCLTNLILNLLIIKLTFIKRMSSQTYFIFKENNLSSLIGLSPAISVSKNLDFWETKILKYLITICYKPCMEVQWKIRFGVLNHVLKIPTKNKRKVFWRNELLNKWIIEFWFIFNE